MLVDIVNNDNHDKTTITANASELSKLAKNTSFDNSMSKFAL